MPKLKDAAEADEPMVGHWTDGFKTEPFDAPYDNSIGFDDAYWEELFRLEALVTEEEGDRITAALEEHDREQKALMKRRMGLPE